MTPDEIRQSTATAIEEISGASDPDGLEQLRIRYLGKKGLLPQIMLALGAADKASKAEIGKLANEFKVKVGEAAKAKAAALVGDGPAAEIDYTLPGNWKSFGLKHPIYRVISDSIKIFSRIGFSVAEGPDVETAYHNFEALNTPPHHPSLDAQDTFWFDENTLLRTQTSPVQIRVMEGVEPPIRVITPGCCYRRDTTDATHSANFYQIEGLYVDRRHVSIAELKGTITYFAHAMMGKDVNVRFRPHFFPFTEPSVEFDFSCHVCAGKGCRVCKDSGWIEISGAGIVDPRVFEKVGYDPGKVGGFAFGMGVERIAMIKYGIPDIRMLYENDLRFLGQFK
jgi:phenylalanyl-tRNA synthetase alpha chain